MSKRTQSIVGTVLAALGGIVLAGVLYLAFAFPQTIEQLADQGRAMSVVERTFADLSNLCATCAFFLIPLLMLGIIVCGVWAVLAGTAARRTLADSAGL